MLPSQEGQLGSSIPLLACSTSVDLELPVSYCPHDTPPHFDMVTTCSKDSKRTALPDSADAGAGAGSKRDVPPESNKSPPPKHQKHTDKNAETEEPVKKYVGYPSSHAQCHKS